MTSFTAIPDTLADAAHDAWPHLTFTGGRHHHGAFHELIQSAEGPIVRSPLGRDALARAEREAAIVRTSGQLSLPVHTPELIEGPIEVNGRVLTLITAVPGSTTEDLTSVNDHRLDAYRGILEALHGTDLSSLGAESGIGAQDTWCSGPTWLHTLRSELWEHVPAEHRALTDQALDAADHYSASITPVLCHGDFGPHNILWEGAQARSLIDLDNFQHADPAIDYASLVGFHGRDALAPIADPETLNRAMVYRALLPLKLAVAAHNAGLAQLRDHALRNFAARGVSNTLFDPTGARPELP